MRALIMLSLALLAAGGGCDLVPVSDMDGYCDVDGEGNLVVTVRNQGAEAAEASTTLVEFWVETEFGTGLYPVELPTPPLPPGQEVQLSLPFYPPCFWNDSGGCQFFITVDAYGALIEENEDNNFVTGGCFGSLPSHE